jgi:hypothetical protein
MTALAACTAAVAATNGDIGALAFGCIIASRGARISVSR